VISFKILIVDDNAAVRRLIAGVVAAFAREIHECNSGSGALAIYRAQRPDLVLMDIEMPDFDGIQATKLICSEDPQARIVMLTAYDDGHLRQSALKAGAFAYLTKDTLANLIGLLESLTDPKSDGA
jgi:NarL family two-component system response regulator LiaR